MQTNTYHFRATKHTVVFSAIGPYKTNSPKVRNVFPSEPKMLVYARTGSTIQCAYSLIGHVDKFSLQMLVYA